MGARNGRVGQERVQSSLEVNRRGEHFLNQRGQSSACRRVLGIVNRHEGQLKPFSRVAVGAHGNRSMPKSAAVTSAPSGRRKKPPVA